METFLKIDKQSGFGLNNIPFGVFRLQNEDESKGRCCTRIGDFVIDLSVLEEAGKLKSLCERVFNRPYLNDFMESGKDCWTAVREELQQLFKAGSVLENEKELMSKAVFDLSNVVMMMPCKVGDYTDFYSSKNHAFNLGSMFRGPENALQPNWLWLPVGYHGRASSVVVSPAEFNRPMGQLKKPDAPKPTLGKSNRMDFELEMVTLVGKSNKLGEPVDIKNAKDHIFGYLLMNDVSARDIQKWEYVPLGPFTAKNCITVVSAWVITAMALEPFKCEMPKQDPAPLDYLQDPDYSLYDVRLEVGIKTEKMNDYESLAVSNMNYLYWSPSQQLTHHTISGCNMQPGDMLGSGTISGPDQSKEGGSLIELSWNGKEKIQLSNKEERTFWADGDTIRMTGVARKDGQVVSFGDCVAKLQP